MSAPPLPYFRTARATFYEGDCLPLLRELPTASVDALVTDPPAGIGFMGKDWDDPDSFPLRGRRGSEKDSDTVRKYGNDVEYDRSPKARRAFIAMLTPIFAEALRVCKPGAHALVWALPRTSHWTATALEDAGWEIRDCIYHVFATGFPKSLNIGVALDQWAGWGTALKPAVECWWLARAPLAETSIARNVAAWGTGALNIDACRVGTGPVDHKQSPDGRLGGIWRSDGRSGVTVPAGRWPPHLLLSHAPECTDSCVPGCPVAELDGQSGQQTSGYMRPGQPRVTSLGGGGYMGNFPDTCTLQGTYGDTGGASRFFPVFPPDPPFRYVAKPDQAERNQGCDALPEQSAGEVTGRADGSAGLQSPRAGAGRTRGARNHHPTVKSLALMRWLCRLITPPNGIVLDCFGGSGSTIVAADQCGFHGIYMEQDPGYCAIARARFVGDAPLLALLTEGAA